MIFIGEFLLAALKSITLEPVMFLDGACNQAMLLFIENVQMHKICSISLGYSEEVCHNLSMHHDVEVQVQREFSLFSFYNSIILSIFPLLYVLFMGAWSDIYGRKIPLAITTGSHVLYAAIYLLSNWQTTWPLEVLYLATLMESLGGGNHALLAFATSYISDITKPEARTSRVSTASSIWYLGGPVGTLVGSILIRSKDFNLALGVVLACYILAFSYVVFFIEESYGPFAKESRRITQQGSKDPKEVTTLQMAKDFLNVRRVMECFKTMFAKREGRARAIIIAIVSSNMIRRAAKCFFMYMFTRRVLKWEAHDYGFWFTYRNTIAALASLFFVPFLCRKINLSDPSLILLGSTSLLLEYVSYGLVYNSSAWFFIWIGPAVGLFANTAIIACRSMPTKLVTAVEKGRMSAVIGALNGLMPVIGYSLFSPIYYGTVGHFPSAQFLFAASLVFVIIVIFIIIQLTCKETINSQSSKYASEPNRKEKNLSMIPAGVDDDTSEVFSSLPKLPEGFSYALPCSLITDSMTEKAGKIKYLVIETPMLAQSDEVKGYETCFRSVSAPVETTSACACASKTLCSASCHHPCYGSPHTDAEITRSEDDCLPPHTCDEEGDSSSQHSTSTNATESTSASSTESKTQSAIVHHC